MIRSCTLPSFILCFPSFHFEDTDEDTKNTVLMLWYSLLHDIICGNSGQKFRIFKEALQKQSYLQKISAVNFGTFTTTPLPPPPKAPFFICIVCTFLHFRSTLHCFSFQKYLALALKSVCTVTVVCRGINITSTVFLLWGFLGPELEATTSSG